MQPSENTGSRFRSSTARLAQVSREIQGVTVPPGASRGSYAAPRANVLA